jgi:hypothetical protein
MTFEFRKAERKKAKLRLGLAGASGSGKTFGALLVAFGLGGKVAVIDTENGSADLYAHLGEYDVLTLGAPFTPERYIQAIKAAEQGGYDTLIIDSTTHEWNGPGGVLEIVDTAAKASRSGSSFKAWGVGTERHRKFVDTIIQSPLNIIATMRSKAAYVQEKKGDRTEIKKVGTAPEQRDGFEYEFTCVLDLSNDGNIATASKDRTGIFSEPQRLSVETGQQLRDWLEQGAEPPKDDGSHNTPSWKKASGHFRSVQTRAKEALNLPGTTIAELCKEFMAANLDGKTSTTQCNADELTKLAELIDADPKRLVAEAPFVNGTAEAAKA